MKNSSIWVVILFQTVFFPECCQAQQAFVVSPNVGGGNTGLYGPFDLGEISFATMRYQQIYGSSDFLIRMPQGGYINGIRFDVADARYGGHPFGTTLPNIQINLSTTPRAVDGLSTVFAENRGLDDIVVLGPTSITLSDSVPGGADVIIAFSTPFFYNPSAGNLLMDVRNFGGGRTSPFNANNVLGDTVSSVYSSGTVNDASGIAITAGLITIFDVTPVPEPSVAALGVAVLVVSVLWRGGREWKWRLRKL